MPRVTIMPLFSPSAADFMVSPRCASVLLTKAAKKGGRGEGAVLSFSHRRFWKQAHLGQLLTLFATKLPTQNLLPPVILKGLAKY